MKFKLGQKVKFNRFSKKIDMSREEYFVTFDDFQDFPEEVKRYRRYEDAYKKGFTGYIAGRRRLVIETYFDIEKNMEPGETDYIKIKKQKYGMFYLVAYDMGKTYFVLEEDLEAEPKKICGNCKHYQECIGEGEGIDTIHLDNEDCGEWEPEE